MFKKRTLYDKELVTINLTPHVVNVEKEGEILIIEPSGIVARVEMKAEPSGDADFITNVEVCEIINLPEPAPNTYYITSMIVA